MTNPKNLLAALCVGVVSFSVGGAVAQHGYHDPSDRQTILRQQNEIESQKLYLDLYQSVMGVRTP